MINDFVVIAGSIMKTIFPLWPESFTEGLQLERVRRLTSNESQPIMVSDCKSRIGELGTFLAERVTDLSPTR